MEFKKVDFVFLIMIAVLLIISVDLLINIEHQKAITNIWDSGGYSDEELTAKLLIVFIVCVVGNLLPVPTPYSWAVCLGFVYFSVNPFIPLLFGLVAACGCLVGEMAGYLVGRGAAEVISAERTKNLEGLEQFLVGHPKVAPFLIFLFGLTPLNDDMLTVPLGLIKYSPKKTIVYMWVGKLGMMLIMAYNVFGICGLLGGENWVLSIVTLFAIVIMVYVMVRVNLVKKVQEVVGKNDDKETQ